MSNLLIRPTLVGSLDGAEALAPAGPRTRTVHFSGMRLPHNAAEQYKFTAYAFNTDRVKGLTASAIYKPAQPTEQRRVPEPLSLLEIPPVAFS